MISLRFPDGTEKSIALLHAPSPQVNVITLRLRKKLSLIFGVKKFHQYLYGKFLLVADHKPLLAILGPKKGIPSLAAARLQRSVCISVRDPVQARRTWQRRWSVATASTSGLGSIHHLSHKTIPQSSASPNRKQCLSPPLQLRQLRRKSKAYRYTKQDWPDHIEQPLKPFQKRQHQLTGGRLPYVGNSHINPQ